MPPRVLHLASDALVSVGQKSCAVKVGSDWLATRHGELVLCTHDPTDPCRDDACDDPDHDACDACTRRGHAQVIFTHYGIFRDVPARTIELAPDRRMRKYSGLLEVMREERREFDEWQPVTIVVYRRTR